VRWTTTRWRLLDKSSAAPTVEDGVQGLGFGGYGVGEDEGVSGEGRVSSEDGCHVEVGGSGVERRWRAREQETGKQTGELESLWFAKWLAALSR
jgi:hypothetical protein